jgi:hypothetical protein
MDFSGIKTITIPEGSVKKITANGVTLWEKISFTNLLPLSIGSDKKPYNNGQGWKANTRLGSSGSESTSSATGMEVTGFIPAKIDDIVYLKNVELIHKGTNSDKCYIWVYDSAFSPIAYWRADWGSVGATDDLIMAETANGNITSFKFGNGVGFTSNVPNMAYFRFSAQGINNNSIVTVNQPIP